MSINDLELSNTFGEWVTLQNNVLDVVNAQLASGVLSDLDTTAKDTLVNAINELHSEVVGKLEASLKATTTQAETGTNDTTYMTPAKVKAAIETFAATTTKDITIEHFAGDGSQTTFTLSGAPGEAKDVFVYVDGIFQNRDTWTLSGDQVIFDTAPWVDSDIEIDWGKAVPLTSVPDSIKDEIVNRAKEESYPIGSLYLNVSGTDPNTELGFGTWSQVAEGRFLVGVGEGTDANSDTRTYSQGDDSVGEYKHTLTIDEMPSHSHSIGIRGSDLPRSPGPSSVRVTGGTTNSSSTGDDQPHENSPPAFGVYVWERTS